MKSVGEVLRSTREKKKISLATVSSQTSISQEYLHAIEQNAFDTLPSDVTTRGFLSLYALALDMDPKTIISLYRRDVPVQPSDLPSLHRKFFVFGHDRLLRYVLRALLAGVAISVTLFMAMFVIRLRQAPPLTISTPKNEAHVISPVLIRGSTTSDAVVQIDGEAIGVNQDGVFMHEVDLDPGLHVLTVKSIGRNRKERVSQLVVTVDEEK